MVAVLDELWSINTLLRSSERTSLTWAFSSNGVDTASKRRPRVNISLDVCSPMYVDNFRLVANFRRSRLDGGDAIR